RRGAPGARAGSTRQGLARSPFLAQRGPTLPPLLLLGLTAGWDAAYMPKMAAAAEGSDVAPEQVIEFAGALLDFVERAVGMRLDYEEETLPVVDHYLGLAQRPLTAELFALVTPAA